MNRQDLEYDSQEALAGSLAGYGIDHTQWDPNKGLPKLWEEYMAGECGFFLGQSPGSEKVTIFRVVTPCVADVFFTQDDLFYILQEDKQVFADNTEKRMPKKHSIYGGVKAGEAPFLALIREIQEELGIDLSLRQKEYDPKSEIVYLGMTETVELPRTYTGLLTCYRRNIYQIFIDETLFRTTYVETQTEPDGTFNKSVHFSWMLFEKYKELWFDRD